jgi:hypothetical protein
MLAALGRKTDPPVLSADIFRVAADPAPDGYAAPAGPSRRPRALPPFYEGSITNEELNRPRRARDEFTSQQLADTDTVAEYFKSRRAILDRSAPDHVPGYIRYGVANWPHFPDELAADWRELLPADHPQRQIGPPLAVNGTPEANCTLVAAHRAIRAAMLGGNTPPEN